MKRTHLFVAASAILFGIQIGYAQTITKKTKSQQKATTPTTSAEQPKPEPPPPFAPVFWKEDISPTEFLRNDPPKVFEWLEAQIKAVHGKTDQFSTQEERQQYEAALAEKMKNIGPLAFVSNCQKKYDADRQVFEIKAPAFAIKDIMLKEPNPEALKLRKLMVGRTNVKKDTYTGQNAYGATTEIIRDVSDDYVIAYPSGAYSEPSSIVTSGNSMTSVSLPYRYNFVYYSTSLSMPPAEAREKDKEISCVAVVSIEPPYIFRFKERDTPTRDLPFDRTSNGFAFYGKFDHLWIVNKATGEVYSKHSRTGL